MPVRPRLPPAEAVALTAARAPDCGFFFDFDGTLAPIQEDPETVQPVPGAVPALAALAGVVRSVQVVSARPVAFLRGRLRGAGPLTLHGLYGLETQRPGGALETHPEALPWAPLVRDLAERARRELPAAVRVEYKRLSLALHYRAAPECREDVERWTGAEAARHGLLAEGGRMVVELRPPVGRGKGDVVRDEIRGLACAWYFGDDRSDLEAFRVLAEREVLSGRFVGVRVAVANPETGADLARTADFVLEAPADVPDLVGRVTAAIGEA